MDKKFRFTKPKVEALPPAAPGKRDEYIDATPGATLRLRVTARGVKTYVVLARLKGGALERVTIGTTAKFTPENARNEAKRILADLATGKSRSAEAKAKRGDITFATLLKDYTDATPMKPRSLSELMGLYTRHIEPALGKRKLAEVTPERVLALHKKVTKDAPTSANRCVAVIKAAFNWATAGGSWQGANPAARVKKNRENSRTRYLQPAELARFFAELNASPEPARSFFMLALLTGARRSNVLAMRWADVSLPDAVWRIRADEAKAGDEIVIPLVPEAVKLLQELKEREGASPVWVLPADSKTGHYQEPKRAWATLCARAELADLRMHDLRRTLGSWLVRTGASTAINAKALGHKSLQAAAVYQRIADTDPIREAMERATSAIFGAGGV